MLRLTIASLCCWLGALAFVIRAIPLSSSLFTEYVYNYEANILFEQNNALGFKMKAKAHLYPLYATSDDDSFKLIENGKSSQLVKLRLTEPIFYAISPSNPNQQLDSLDYEQINIDRRFQHLHNPEHDLYAHIITLSNGTAIIKDIYTHQADSATFKNLKKSILLNLLPTSHHLKPVLSSRSSSSSSAHNQPTCTDDNNLAQPELFSPDSISNVNIIAKTKVKQSPSAGAESTTQDGNLILGANGESSSNPLRPIIFKTIEGYQNVTFGSRVFSEAQSNLTTNFKLDLINELKSNLHEQFDDSGSISSAIKLILVGKQYQADTIELQREARICSHHHCGKNLLQLFQDYHDQLTHESLASVEAAVAFLRLLERLRDARGGTNMKEILQILKQIKGHDGIESSFLDILAAARTKDSIMAAFKHIKLTKNNNLDIGERFLSVLSVVAKTASKMQLKRPIFSPYYFTQTNSLKRGEALREQESHMASLEFIAQELLQIIKQTPAQKWASEKLRWSSLLTLATLINAVNQEQLTNSNKENRGHSTIDKNIIELNEKVSRLLLNELKLCQQGDTDCRIVVLQAIGNVGTLDDEQFQTLKDQVLNSGRRESISAMRVLRDLLQVQPKDREKPQSFYTQLKDLLLRVVYDSSHETTARVLASEMIVRFIPNSLASEELLNHLPSFNNNELATMIYSRMQSLKPDSLAKHNDNWYWKSCIINGTSTSFVRTMARTDSLNASYGVNVELMNRGKVLKESSFDVFLDTKKRTQDLFSLGIFARGLSSFAGGGADDGSEDENESTMAGMTLRLLGGYLRPYVFFSGTGELMSHIWAGTASEPTTAFNGNLLLIDHVEGYPLISGFVVEQQMRGVLSIDVSGKVKISLWHRNSHSVVRTKASIIVQASQSVFTSYDNFWQSHLFSFGGQALIDFVADLAFSSSPPKICLQVTQPEFIIRYNSRRRDQVMTNEVRRKITRKNYSIGAKSYSLNTENNKMCSLMNDEL